MNCFFFSPLPSHVTVSIYCNFLCKKGELFPYTCTSYLWLFVPFMISFLMISSEASKLSLKEYCIPSNYLKLISCILTDNIRITLVALKITGQSKKSLVPEIIYFCKIQNLYS